jgi:hypothetical protein
MNESDYLRSKGLHTLADLRKNCKTPKPTWLEAALSGIGFLILVFYFLWSITA